MTTSLELITEHTRSIDRHRSNATLKPSILMIVTVAGLLLMSACTGVDSPEFTGESSESDGAQPDTGSTADEEGASSDDSDSGSGSESEGEPGGGSDGSLATAPEGGDAHGLALLAELPGQLAIGDGTRLLVGRADGQGLVEVDGSESVLASQPTWSHTGEQLIWTSANADEQLAKILRFGENGLPVGDPVVSDAAGPPIFYYQWNQDDDSVLYLRNSPAGAQVEAGRLTPGQDVVPVAVGSPFFASWAPDGEFVAVHRNNFEIGIFDQFSGDEIDNPEATAPVAKLPRTRSEFTTPAWLGDSTILVVNDGDLAVVDINPSTAAMTVTEELVANVGPVRFVVSPDRTKIAFQRPPDQEPDVVEAALPIQSGGPTLAVLDLETGDTALVTDSLAVAWEWSPDSKRLAWLEADTSGLARWQFWSTDPTVAGQLPGNDTAPSLRLSRKYLNNYLPFFAQFTHSVTGWSPDSQAFAAAGTAEGVGGIWVHLVEIDSPVLAVAEGDFVTWGGGPTPPVVGAAIT